MVVSSPLPTFFANVFHFMRNSPLDPNGMKKTAQQIETILKGETGPIAAMAEIQLPTCPSVGSDFQAVGLVKSFDRPARKCVAAT